MKSLASHFVKDESGATVIEYGLVASIVSIIIVSGLMLMAPQLEALYSKIKDALVSVNI
jgi:pilus assembly protein Flp/PilA